MTTRIKICGLTRKEDALFAAEAGADYLGVVFVPDSPRAITPERLAEFIYDIPESVKKVGVFKNEDDREIRHIMELCSLDIVQLHGTEDPAFADLLAFGIRCMESCPVSSFVRFLRLRELSPLSSASHAPEDGHARRQRGIRTGNQRSSSHSRIYSSGSLGGPQFGGKL